MCLIDMFLIKERVAEVGFVQGHVLYGATTGVAPSPRAFRAK